MSAEAVGSVETAEPGKPKRKWLKRTIITILVVLAFLVVLIVAALWWTGIPTKAAGLTAQSVCSGTFVGGRDAQNVYDEDVIPQSPALGLVSFDANTDAKTVTSKFLGIVSRTAAFAGDRGCVLDIDADPNAQPYAAPPAKPGEWPQGDQAIPESQWGSGVNSPGLQQVVDQEFIGAGDPEAGNARGVAIVQGGKLLTEKTAPGFDAAAPQLGWSMTKTVNAMLFYQVAVANNMDLDAKVVDSFPADREPQWVAQWRQDGREAITVNDLLHMRAGLDIEDDYGILGKVVNMLYNEPSMADYAASQSLVSEPGTAFAYSTGEADILSQIAQARFPTDQAYWEFPTTALLDPIGVTSGTMTTDTSGTWVGGSYLWANPADWARMGQMMMQDGVWEGKEVLPKGWLDLAKTRSLPTGEGAGYGAQTWFPGDPVGGECKGQVPEDTMSMEGHYGQIVAMVPSYDAVIVRMGWTINKDEFSGCQFMADVLKNLPQK
ncbi:MAG: serine hydrolase [Actinobacteria bacterium]|nr:serine hydrolase [Actinomycetota bacterium]